MINALGRPQTVLLLGGTSEIAQAVVAAWARTCRPLVVLAARPGPRRDAAAAHVESLGLEVEVVDFDAERTEEHPALIDAVSREHDIDVAIVAFGVLGDEEQAWQDHAAATRLARVNYTGAVSVGVCLADVMRRQGHGMIVALSSVAGERVRRSNFVYGSTKAGMDGFYLGLGEALRGSGAGVLVVRPGFVRTRMTAGRSPAPLSVTAEQVADAVVRGVARRDELIWVPAPLRGVMSGLRHVPRPLFRRLPL
ncbi:decaprenylphospho-beta-D-erythro-pentofuranosid-2-ulose 2-reductase [Nocardioides panaciterrulae]|uniref:Decaprenylphospho-beta-D-erythro-pentofuranosid-2-ulose 2-reductase n=1 Tax=Nocardioides panaciterrulae TaxID=661492 RepID=A0A7Y9JBS8_9ACTN|nr:decaprenylphospho-beta-D-erythro-pentofuranosid-2-ulose 2-reductase [Nocardioides panaciterrulae]NYD41544.1 decaprenylphospho-beta-D-erythro-pentofuranosid-2-ulose 2-reductase [Nocardioides panaciterrulae]